MYKQNQLSRNCDAKLQPFLVPPELFPKCIGSSQFGTNTLFSRRLCSKPFLADGLHAAAGACYADVY